MIISHCTAKLAHFNLQSDLNRRNRINEIAEIDESILSVIWYSVYVSIEAHGIVLRDVESSGSTDHTVGKWGRVQRLQK